uniref:Protein kinase domain-containing protein n=1 Tax=Chlamydomonas leiostraca TaxID=1034604 RepID=A0A7S0WPX1_9CHLO|mmetsp:Transcript_22558/g.57310  ORF Transcript_22558/g.57310 Transcript_22558/m.57310 type:complete len:153 (+) Transcript_22558:3-461(+)
MQQKPYLVNALDGSFCANPKFPHMTISTHPRLTVLVRSCLLLKPKARPSAGDALRELRTMLGLPDPDPSSTDNRAPSQSSCYPSTSGRTQCVSDAASQGLDRGHAAVASAGTSRGLYTLRWSSASGMPAEPEADYDDDLDLPKASLDVRIGP